MLKLCGETQDKLAQELILFELTIERDVMEPLYDLSEVRQRHTPFDYTLSLSTTLLFVTLVLWGFTSQTTLFI